MRFLEKQWALKHNFCVECGTIKIKHRALGFCRRCYQKRFRKNYYIPVKNPDWSWNYNKCIKCGTKKEKHCARGLCILCYKEQNAEKNNTRMKKYNKIRYVKRKGGIYKYLLDELNRELEKGKKEEEKRRKKNIYARKYAKSKRGKDFKYKLKHNISHSMRKRLRKRLSSSFSFRDNNCTCWGLLSYSLNDLVQHLEELFTEGMSWQNYGPRGWHIDHKRPDCSFNYKSVGDKEFQECWALKNLQPLWAEDNERKSGKWDGQ